MGRLIIKLFLLFFMISSINASILLTDKEKEFIENHPIIKVGNDKFWPPFDFYEDNQAKGFSVDYLKELGTISGLKFEFIQGESWEALTNKLKTKKLDILTALEPTLKNKKFALFSDDILVTFESMITQKKYSNLNSYRDLYGKKVGIIKGYDLENEIKENHKQIDMVLFDTPLEAIHALSDGRIDVFIENSSVALYLMNKHFISNLKLNASPKFPNLDDGDIIKVASRIDYPELHSIIQKAIKLIPDDKKIYLHKKWISSINNLPNKTTIIALTKEEKEYLKNKKVIKMCVDPNWMPFERIKNSKHIGLASDYIKLFSKKLNIPIELVATSSWSESLQKAKSRECDILSLASNTPLRSEYMDFTSPYMVTPIVVATKIGIPFIDSIESIKEKKLGVVKGYSFNEILRSKYPNINLVEVDSTKDGLNKVESGKIFGYIDNSIVINDEIQKNYVSTLAVSGKFIYKSELSIATRNDEVILNNIFQKAIDSIDYVDKQKILSKWVKISYASKHWFGKFYVSSL